MEREISILDLLVLDRFSLHYASTKFLTPEKPKV